MYQSFSIISLEPKFADGEILVTTNFDVDSESVNDSTIKLFSKADRVPCEIDFKVDGSNILILLKSEIVPNTEYVLVVTKIKTVLGEILSSGIRRKIIFTSEVKEIPKIISPSLHEEITDLRVTLKPVLEDAEGTLSQDKTFFIQIAEDVAFINLVVESTTDKETTNFKDLKPGQYFIRARVDSIVNGIKYNGKWSETVTFGLIEQVVNDSDNNEDNDGPEYIEELKIISSPSNGETPESILIEFSAPISEDFLNKILVIRRDV